MRVKPQKNKLKYDRYIILEGDYVVKTVFVPANSIPLDGSMVKIPKELEINAGDKVIIEGNKVMIDDKSNKKKQPWWKF